MDSERIDLDQVRAVLKIASEATDIAELTVETPRLKVSVKKAGGRIDVQAHANPGAYAPAAATAPPAAEPAATDHMKAVAAPMVGTFYRAPSPDAPPFVNEGDHVETGQTVCIIEAMKLFNEIQSEWRGRVARLLVENGTPVEYGQPLLLIEPVS
ncbi:MAG: acetyl-CoA carboxylase biotin carboxyl carrier protein [bacterium]